MPSTERERLRLALEFYADARSYAEDDIHSGYRPILADAGANARAALKFAPVPVPDSDDGTAMSDQNAAAPSEPAGTSSRGWPGDADDPFMTRPGAGVPVGYSGHLRIRSDGLVAEAFAAADGAIEKPIEKVQHPAPAGEEDMRLREGLGATYTQLVAGDTAGAQRTLEAVLAGGDVPDLAAPAGGDGLACARCGVRTDEPDGWTVAHEVGLLCPSCTPSMPPLERVERPALVELLTSDEAIEALRSFFHPPLGVLVARRALSRVAARLSSSRTSEQGGTDG